MIRQWVLIYLAVIIVMIVIHRRMRRGHTALVRSLIARMDELVAHYTSTLWQHRDEIHQYEENVGLLFRTMDDMLHDPRASYHQYMSRWHEDIEYASSLLPGAIELPDVDDIRETDESLGRIERLYQTRGMLIAILTLGLYLLWKQPLYSA